MLETEDSLIGKYSIDQIKMGVVTVFPFLPLGPKKRRKLW